MRMNREITAMIVDDDTILIDGCKQVGMDEVVNAFRSAQPSDPNYILVIQPKDEYYKGIATSFTPVSE